VTLAAPDAGEVERAPLARALDRVCGTRAIPGNAITPLTDGPRAYAAMLEMIDQAHRWVHFENYIIRDDETGRGFASCLEAAARRGVEVRLLYDHFGSLRTRRRFWHRLRSAGVEVRPFNQINPLRPVRSLRRDHRKYVGVDGIRAVLGGICIGDEWAGSPGADRPPWRDEAVAVAGPAVPALEWSFLRLWSEAGGSAPAYAVPSRVDRCGDASVRVIEGLPGRLRLYRAIELLAASAESRLWITDAYLLVATPLFVSLMAAAREGVDVRLLVPGHSDLPPLKALTRVGYRELLEADARIWEWHGPMLHAKTIVADGTWWKVGSSNLNPSSFLANYELDILVEHGGAVAAAAQQFRRDLAESTEVVLRPARVPAPLRQRLPPAVASADPATRSTVPRARGELSRRAVVTLRKVAGGARRSILGAVIFALLGAGSLLLILPHVTAYALAVLCFWLGGAAVLEFLRRRNL
jgi:cardiolipin synthase